MDNPYFHLEILHHGLSHIYIMFHDQGICEVM